MFKVNLESLKEPFVKNWYIKVRDKETGPYSYTEVCIMIANNDVDPNEEITMLGHGSWHKLNEVELFSRPTITKFLAENRINVDTDIPLKKSIRVPLTVEIAVVCNGRMFKAATCDISSSGMMVKLRKNSVKESDHIKAHLYSVEDQKIGSFNFHAKVVRKINRKSEENFLNQFEYFGIEFEALEESGKDYVKALIRQSIMEGHKKVPVDEIFGARIKDLDYGPSRKTAI